MGMARETAKWSKHPETKIGCVVVDDDHNQLSGGFNGLPRGANDSKLLDQDRDVSLTVHAEANAVAAAARNGHSLRGGTIYVTAQPCSQCAALLIQAGITRVVYSFLAMNRKWTKSAIEAERLFRECGVEVREFLIR